MRVDAGDASEDPAEWTVHLEHIS